MKKFYFLPMAIAATLTFGACSSDDIAGGGDTPSHNFADGGYVKLNINLPSQQATGFRAPNDNFNDGLAAEYAVKNATLILFQGDNEKDAKFHSAYSLNITPPDEAPANNQITQTAEIVKRVDNALPGDKLYALVVLNNNGVVTAAADGLTIQGQKFMNGDFEDFTKAVVNGGNTTFTTNGFFMTNAPLSTVPGGSAAPSKEEYQTLVNVTNNIYPSEAEARESPAADIYVERAMGKVTVQPIAKGNLSADGLSTVEYQIQGWALDITNKKSFIVRTPVEGTYNLASGATGVTNPYRFVGSTAVKDEVSLYRTYWGLDPNYNLGNALDLSDFTMAATPDKFTFNTTYGDNNPAYCMENTFDVPNQNVNQTTRVVIAAQLGDGSDFYTLGNSKTAMYTLTDVQNYIKSAILSNASVRAWQDQLAEELHQSVALGANNISNITLSPRNEATGRVTVTGFTLSYDTHTFSGDILEALNTAVGNVTKYTGGISYYPVRIKHFGDDLTPWGWNGETTANSYPTTNQAANYLGRYGVLRNNWYDISVTGIRTIGEAVVPPSTDVSDPDDKPDNYIAVSINILSWAKRSQSVEL